MQEEQREGSLRGAPPRRRVKHDAHAEADACDPCGATLQPRPRNPVHAAVADAVPWRRRLPSAALRPVVVAVEPLRRRLRVDDRPARERCLRRVPRRASLALDGGARVRTAIRSELLEPPRADERRVVVLDPHVRFRSRLPGWYEILRKKVRKAERASSEHRAMWRRARAAAPALRSIAPPCDKRLSAQFSFLAPSPTLPVHRSQRALSPDANGAACAVWRSRGGRRDSSEEDKRTC